MKRLGLIPVFILLLPSPALANFIPPSPENEIVSYLGKKYGDDYMKKLEKISIVQKKIEFLNGERASKLKTLLKSAKQYILLENAKNDFDEKILASKTPIYARILEQVARYNHINPWSQSDLATMKEIIKTEKISPNSLYFKAYLSLRERIASLKGQLRLPVRFTHSLQLRKLSCESNTATDLINFYRTNSGLVAMNEVDFINILPIRSGKIVRTNANFIWGDPNKYFVGNLDGKQSSNPNLFTGYGIYADGIVPIINRFLSLQNLSVQKGIFDERRILDSLSKKHPIMFWYLSAISENDDGVKKYSTKPIIWKTPE